MSEFWDDIIPRLLGILAGLLVTWLTGRGYQLDEKEVTALFVGVYAIVHRAIVAGRTTVRTARAARRGIGQKRIPRDD